MDATKLPPLPEPEGNEELSAWPGMGKKDYAAEQMTTYGAACYAAGRAQGLEEAAKIAESTYEGSSQGQDDDSGYSFYGENSADAIRQLGEKK